MRLNKQIKDIFKQAILDCQKNIEKGVLVKNNVEAISVFKRCLNFGKVSKVDAIYLYRYYRDNIGEAKRMFYPGEEIIEDLIIELELVLAHLKYHYRFKEMGNAVSCSTKKHIWQSATENGER